MEERGEEEDGKDDEEEVRVNPDDSIDCEQVLFAEAL